MLYRAISLFFLLCCFLVASGHVSASSIDVVDVYEDSPRNLIGKAEYASAVNCSGYDVKTIQHCGSLQTLEHATLNLGFNSEPHWFIFTLKNSSAQKKNIYVELSNPLLDSIELHVIDSGHNEVEKYIAGDLLPFTERPIKQPNFVFPIDVPANEHVDVRIRIATVSSLQVPILIWQPEQFSSTKFSEFLLFGVFIGAMLVLAIYNFIMWIATGDKSYFFCAATLFLYALVQGDLLGINFAVLWPDSTKWNQVSVVIFDVLAIATVAVFAQNFLQMKKQSKYADRLLTTGATLCVLLVLSIPFVPYYFLVIGTAFLVATIPLIATVKSALLWREGLIAARYFVFAFAFFVFAVAIFIASKFGYLPRTLMTEYSIHLGAVVVVICLSLAVADQQNHDLKQKDKAQKGSIDALRKYEEIYTNSSEGIFRLDSSGVFVGVNPAFLKIIGATSLENLKEHFSDLPSMVLKNGSSLLDEIKSQDSTVNVDLLCQRLDNKRVWVTLNTRLHRSADNQIESIEGSMIDISERKEVENELQDTLLRLDESVKAGHIGIWDWDLKTNTVRFSKEYKQQLGYADDEFENDFKEWESRVHPEDIQETLNSVQQSIETRSQNHQALFRIKHKGGTYKWILSHASVIQGEDGQPERMIGSHVDITDRKLLEEELRQSQKMEAIGHLAGGIAHDFNNLLASIMGFAELLEHNLADSKLSGYAKKIITAAENSRNLTNQLLTFSRKQSLHLEALDIHTQLDEVIELLNHFIDKRIKIDKKFDSLKTEIMGDTSLIQNALLNLGLNARDAMPDGGSISIATRYVAASDLITPNQNLSGSAFIQIDVKDTGCGIAESDLSRIFEPFFTTKELGKGTGMGLASVYGAIEQLSGKILVESEVGVGSCFTIFLPLVESSQKSDVIDNNNHFEKSELSKTILVVDDEPLIRELCGDFLKVLGHKALLAADGIEAIKMYKDQWADIDLVILDMMMPTMNGKEVFIELKKINQSVNVIIASGYAADNLISEMIDLGAALTMSKPFKLSALEESINSVITG